MEPDETPELWIPREGELCRRELSVSVRRNRTRGADEDNRTTVTINTADEDRHGTVIEPGGADLAAFNANPVVLVNHDRNLLAATGPVALSNGNLVANVDDEAWDLEDPLIVRWYRKVKRGMLRTASIGFRVRKVVRELRDPDGDPLDWKNIFYRIVEWELLEWSFVTVPSNPHALVTQRMLDAGVARLGPAASTEASMLAQLAAASAPADAAPESEQTEQRETVDPDALLEPPDQPEPLTADAVRELIRAELEAQRQDEPEAATPPPPAPPAPIPADFYGEIVGRLLPAIDERIQRQLGRR